MHSVTGISGALILIFQNIGGGARASVLPGSYGPDSVIDIFARQGHAIYFLPSKSAHFILKEQQMSGLLCSLQ